MKIDYDVENVEAVENEEFLEIFTNQEVKSNTDWTWFYRAYGTEDSEDGGDVNLCQCAECCNFGKDLFEYFSIYTALTWVKDNYPDADITLWVGSDKFMLDISEDLLWYYEEIYKCAFLITLAKDITQLLAKLNVEVLQYCYANKDIIPSYF
jgi:hypothetical protein